MTGCSGDGVLVCTGDGRYVLVVMVAFLPIAWPIVKTLRGTGVARVEADDRPGREGNTPPPESAARRSSRSRSASSRRACSCDRSFFYVGVKSSDQSGKLRRREGGSAAGWTWMMCWMQRAKDQPTVRARGSVDREAMKASCVSEVTPHAARCACIDRSTESLRSDLAASLVLLANFADPARSTLIARPSLLFGTSQIFSPFGLDPEAAATGRGASGLA